MLDKAGLQVNRIRFVSFEHDPYGWLQTMLNLVGLKQNRLTRILMQLDRPATNDLVHLISAGLLMLPSMLLALVSWFFGTGALIEVEAVSATLDGSEL